MKNGEIDHNMNLNTKLSSTYLLIGVCSLLGIAFSFPYVSSSIMWTLDREYVYENHHKIKIPFRWITGEGAGLVLKKPYALLSYNASSMLPSEVEVSDNGSSLKDNDRKRELWFRVYGITNTAGVKDDRTYPFASNGLICGRVGGLEPSRILMFTCISPDYRYSFRYSGRMNDIRDASGIAKQIIGN